MAWYPFINSFCSGNDWRILYLGFFVKYPNLHFEKRKHVLIYYETLSKEYLLVKRWHHALSVQVMIATFGLHSLSVVLWSKFGCQSESVCSTWGFYEKTWFYLPGLHRSPRNMAPEGCVSLKCLTSQDSGPVNTCVWLTLTFLNRSTSQADL